MNDDREQSEPKTLSTPPASEALTARGRGAVARFVTIGFILLLVGLTAWSVWVFGITLYRDYLVVPEEEVVPKVVGLEIRDAYETMEKLGLKLQVHESRHDKSVPRRVVLSQNPPAGRKVRLGRTIFVVVSLGPEFMNVPALEGQSLRSAKIALSNAKLRLGKVTFEEGTYGQDEAIVKQMPEAGKEVQRGQLVHLTVRRAYR